MLDCTVRQACLLACSCKSYCSRCVVLDGQIVAWLRLRGLEHTGEHADMTFTFTWGVEGSKGKNGFNIYKAPQEFSRSPYLAVAVNRMDI